MNKRTAYILFLALPLSALLFLLYCLETYTVHHDTEFFVCVYSIIALAACTFLWLLTKSTVPHSTTHWLLSTAVLVFVFYAASKIPLCPVCDKTTAEDLGFLIRWIPLDTPH